MTDAHGVTHGATLTVRDKTGVAEVSVDGTLAAQEILLSIRYDAAFNPRLEGLYKVRVGEDAYAVTQMEATSARHAFASFDEPRFKTPFDLTLTVLRDEVAVLYASQVAEAANRTPFFQWLQSNHDTLARAAVRPLNALRSQLRRVFLY